MSVREYRASMDLESAAHATNADPFYALLMAAMRAADSDNVAVLRKVWPKVCDELMARYHAPRGLLPGEGTDDYAADAETGALVPAHPGRWITTD